MARPKGALNKTTRGAKLCIERVAEQIGGAERMKAWVEADPGNERLFWSQIYPKLLPLQVSGDENGAPIRHVFGWAGPNG